MVKLKILRENQGLTQVQLAAKAGVGYSTIQKTEYGLSFPTYQVLDKLAKALDVAISDLVD
ncbi:MAG: helix-turn-helix transcriptional regulator [Dehalococcoidales bacterium]|nr:helix-turn-helix transcriptional regulator [Dehalococcoidales bacterium]